MINCALEQRNSFGKRRFDPVEDSRYIHYPLTVDFFFKLATFIRNNQLLMYSLLMLTEDNCDMFVTKTSVMTIRRCAMQK